MKKVWNGRALSGLFGARRWCHICLRYHAPPFLIGSGENAKTPARKRGFLLCDGPLAVAEGHTSVSSVELALGYVYVVRLEGVEV